MTQLTWNSAEDGVWLQTFKASEDVPTRAARPAVSKFAVTVQSQKSHKLHTWAHDNCRHIPVSLKFKAGVKPIKGHFITFLLLGVVWAFAIKATLTWTGGINLKRSLPAVWRRECHSLSHLVHLSICGIGICRLEKQPPGRAVMNSKGHLGRIYEKLHRHTRRCFPRGAQAPPRSLVCWHWSPSELGWWRNRGRHSSGMSLDTSASSWHSLVFKSSWIQETTAIQQWQWSYLQ